MHNLSQHGGGNNDRAKNKKKGGRETRFQVTTPLFRLTAVPASYGALISSLFARSFFTSDPYPWLVIILLNWER